MAAAPRLDINEDGGQRRISVLGDWRLIELLRGHNDAMRELESLRVRPDDIWDFSGLGSLDSAGALLFWRCWRGQRPGTIEGAGEHERWLERFSDAHLERPALPGRMAGLSGFLPGLGALLAGFAIQGYGVLLCGGQFLVDLWHCVQNPRLFPRREFTASVYRVGTQALFLNAFLGLIVGFVLTWQVGGQIAQFGLNQAVIGAIGLAFTRELGPFIAALVLVGRTGSATTAGIGAMHITEEIDALRAFGVSPTLRVAMPRILAMTVAMPLLVVWTDFWGIVGGIYISSVKLGVTWQMWLNQFPGSVPIENYFLGVGKGAMFGFIIGITSVYYGLRAPPDTQGLTQNITRSVVVGLAMVLVVESAMGIAFSGIGL
ncbi:MAG: ABC transporter permease [Gammaproteobacteria bacterium]|nr:ABC transporter permease [Gammaproteobacteria bacterium]